MAANSGVSLEVRPTGSDTNGGFFLPGASGTDWSQQAAAQYAVTDAVTNGTTTITSASAAFGVDVVGNGFYITGGTGAIVAGWYQVISRTNATTIVVDRTTGLTAGTGATLNLGGCLATPAGLAACLASCTPAAGKAWLKNGTTYTSGANITINAGAVNPFPFMRISGYNAVRGDGGKAVLQLTGSATIGLILAGVGTLIENIVIDCNNLATSTGATMATNTFVRKCVIKNFTTAGVSGGGGSATITDNEFTGGGSGATGAVLGGSLVSRNWVHDNQCPGIIAATLGMVIENLVVNNTGASSDGIRLSSSPGPYCYRNTIYGNGRHGILFNAGALIINMTIKNNLIVSNGGAGVTTSSSSVYADYATDGNAYFNNTSGNRVNMDSVAGVFAQDPYTNVLDVILTADPFTNAAGGDFSINNNAGGGAAVRGAGNPQTVGGGPSVGKPDFGVLQHADPVTGKPPIQVLRSNTWALIG